MRKTGVVLVVLLTVLAAAAQQQPSGTAVQVFLQAPRYADVYCAGFISKDSPEQGITVGGGWNTPHTTRFVSNDYIYLLGGSFTEGQQYSILREAIDPNEREGYYRQKKIVREVGKPYEEVARVRIVGVRDNAGIAQVEYSCEAVVPGDFAVPFSEKTIPEMGPKHTFDRFAAPDGDLTGWIVLAKDFDIIMGTRHKVYLNRGSNDGVKVGDYFRVIRDYVDAKNDEVDGLSYEPPIRLDKHADLAYYDKGNPEKLPRRSLGQLIVVGVTPTSATGMITYALEDIHVGDGVERMEPPPPPPPPVMNPPLISCTANPATVEAGGTSAINCQVSSPDNRPVSTAFQASAGSIEEQDSRAMLTTTGLSAGTVTVTATATDDRNLSSQARVMVNVEVPPPAPEPSKLNEIAFRRNSARVDNRAKAVLDDVALRLEREPDAKAILVGYATQNERGADRLGLQRAQNAARYLTEEKGIDANRLETRSATDSESKVEIWLVPAGAQMP